MRSTISETGRPFQPKTSDRRSGAAAERSPARSGATPSPPQSTKATQMPTCHFHPKSSSFFCNFSPDLACVSHEKPRISDLKEHDDQIKIMCICRLLFENTNGWKPIAGAEIYSGQVYTNLLERFPLFPMALSEGIPFFIYRGFNFTGCLAEDPGYDLQLCEGFAMIPADLPEFNYQKAAIKLLQSEPFLKLYKIPDYAESDYTVDLMCEIIWQTDIIPKKQVNP